MSCSHATTGWPAKAAGAAEGRRIPTNILRYVWQLPQHLVGVALLLVLRRRIIARRREGENLIHLCFRRFGGLSLGRYLYVHRDAGPELLRHELGHCQQSLLLGPLYLPIVALPSILWAALFPLFVRLRPRTDYFAFFTESWANRLAPAEIDDEKPPQRFSSSPNGENI